MNLFSDLRELVQMLGEKCTLLSELVVSLEADYASLYKTRQGRHYADFQMRWLEHIRHVAEYWYALATVDAK